tara:strand:- start:1246 stop:1521 length:276 start_codon:yes stop_codon:yes gene_type:complete
MELVLNNKDKSGRIVAKGRTMAQHGHIEPMAFSPTRRGTRLARLRSNWSERHDCDPGAGRYQHFARGWQAALIGVSLIGNGTVHSHSIIRV